MAGVPDSNPNPNTGPLRPATPASGGPSPESSAEFSTSSTSGVDDIVKEIREGLAEITARELELRRDEQYFGRRYRDLEQAALRTFTQEHDEAQQRLVQQAAELNAQAVEIAAQRARLKGVTDEIHARQVELEQQRGDLTRRTQQTRQRTESLRLWLQEQHEVLNQRRDALRRQEEELETRVRSFREDMVRERAESDVRRAELEAQAAKLGESEQNLLERQVELERQAAARAAQQPAAEAPLPGPPTLPATSPVAHFTELPRDVWWPRVSGVACLVTLLCATGWILAHPATYRVTTSVRIVSETPLPSEIISRHRQQLVDPALLGDKPLASAWRAACEEARVTAKATDGGGLSLSVTAREPSDARRLSAAACAAYARRVQTGVGNTELPLGYQDLVLRREELEARLTQLRRVAADEPAATDAAALDERELASVAAGQLEVELTDVRAALDEQRASLAVLVATEVPHRTVDPAAVEQALAEDTIYREDREEFHAVALQYRTELAIGMLMLVDPIKVANKALTALAGSLAEQRGLEPAAEIGAVLEECAAAVSQTQGRFAPLGGQWQAWLETVQNIDVSADVVALVSQQNQASETARRLADDGVALVDQIGAKIETLSSRGGGTREVVVAAVLRGDQAGLKAAMEAFSAAAGKTATGENFELDAQDRKLRGLRMRLNGRREAITQQVQLEADRVAREQHAAELQETREQVRGLERRREELVSDLATALRKLRTLDEAVRRHEDWKLRAGQRDAEIAWVAARSDEITQELAEAQQQGTVPEQIEFTTPVIQRLSPGRTRSAALAGGGGFVVAWLLGALLSRRNSG